MAKFQSNTDFRLKSVRIYPQGKDKPIPITNLVTAVNYVEDITSPFISATMEVVDSGGLLQGMPIQGGEKILIQVDTNIRDEAFEYSFVIWKIGNRFAKQKKQSYTIGLISEEALVNEGTRVLTRQEGNPEQIVEKLVQKSLNSSKPFFSEPSKFQVKFLPNRRRPFDIISSLAIKAVSSKGKWSDTTQNKAFKMGVLTPGGISNNDESIEEIRGSSGFFFWESRRGYNFFSVDALCDEPNGTFSAPKLESESWGPYVEKVGNQEDGADDRFTIYESVFDSEIDLMTSLRKGKYASKVVFFNHSTGQYEEYNYKIKSSYDNMAHLGGQESVSLIPVNQTELSDQHSRVMSIMLDHETWYNDPNIASINTKDGATKPTEFADWQKFYAAQSLARYQLLKNQQCSIVIPGNAEICAGDKIDVRLVNKLPDKEAKKQPFDKESSGLYLIQEATHTYDRTIGTNGRFLTTLRLMRDSYGMKDLDSGHGTK
tara:strand:+ start:7300 stop:8757 length:1458 start_codon:yes stop_codon:yes gene_type:complete